MRKRGRPIVRLLSAQDHRHTEWLQKYTHEWSGNLTCCPSVRRRTIHVFGCGALQPAIQENTDTFKLQRNVAPTFSYRYCVYRFVLKHLWCRNVTWRGEWSVRLDVVWPKVLNFVEAEYAKRCATNRKVAGSIPFGVSEFFIDIKSFRSHYGPGVDLASNKWVPGVFPGGKGGSA